MFGLAGLAFKTVKPVIYRLGWLLEFQYDKLADLARALKFEQKSAKPESQPTKSYQSQTSRAVFE